MSRHDTVKSKLMREHIVKILKEYGVRTPKRTLGKILFAKYPNIFSSVDLARSAVRRFFGCNGTKNRRFQHTETTALAESFKAEAKYPDEIQQFNWKPYELPDLGGYWLIIADLHIPFHKLKPLKAAIQAAKRIGKKLKGILILGDLCDQYSCSWWPIDPKIVTYETELNSTREFLYQLKNDFPGREIIFKQANHEHRLERFVMSIRPELATSDSVRSIFKLSSILSACGNDDVMDGIKMIDDGQIVYYKELILIHGDEFGKTMGNPVSPARTLFLKTRACAIQAHSHVSSGFTKSDIDNVQYFSHFQVGRAPVSTWVDCRRKPCSKQE